jgi:hypothetical protein
MLSGNSTLGNGLSVPVGGFEQHGNGDHQSNAVRPEIFGYDLIRHSRTFLLSDEAELLHQKGILAARGLCLSLDLALRQTPVKGRIADGNPSGRALGSTL